jgi:class 3 adenylate cyclase
LSVSGFRGVEMDTAGDGFFAAFDGPARAIKCAEEITQAVQPLGIHVRAGLHTGECEIADGKVADIAVSIGRASRLRLNRTKYSSPAPSKFS